MRDPIYQIVCPIYTCWEIDRNLQMFDKNIQYLRGNFQIFDGNLQIFDGNNFLSDCFYNVHLLHTRDCHCRITGSEQHTKPKEKSCVAMKIEETRKEPCQTKFGVVKNTCLPFGLSMFQCFNVCTIESSGCEEDNAD